MRIALFATGDIALPILDYLAGTDAHELVCLVTQPDKPVGRRQTLTPPPTKTAAVEHGVPVLQPTRIRNADAVAEVGEFAPDVIVVMAYGQILPLAVLELPKLACLNLHASLLPLHRGAAPVQAAINAGDSDSGITVMYMAEGLDTGDVLLEKVIPLAADETGGSLHDRLADLAVPALDEALGLLGDGVAPRVPQDDALATYAAKLSRESARIDWSCDAVEIERMIRAMNPWPAASTTIRIGERDRQLKVFAAVFDEASGALGEVLGADDAGLLIGCGQGSLRLVEIQLEGKRRMSAEEFLRGRAIESSTVLGC